MTEWTATASSSCARSTPVGPFRALFGVTLSVEPGEAVALIGSNGAGKTTVARVASGLVAPSGGVVTVDGHDLTGAGTYRFAQAGVAHAVEGRSVFATITVEENLTLSFRRVHGRSGVKADLETGLGPVPGPEPASDAAGRDAVRWRAADALDGPGDGRSPQGPHRRRASLGLAPIIVDELYKTLGRLRGEGTSLLIIEQQVSHALAWRPRRLPRPGDGVLDRPRSEAAAIVQMAYEPTD